MHISHGIIIKRNFARCLRAFYGSGLSLKGMLLRVTCFIAHQPGTPRRANADASLEGEMKVAAMSS